MKKEQIVPMYHVYILECADGTFYTGSTNDLRERLRKHNNTKSGARYTKIRRPVILRYSELCKGRGAALSRELVIKRLSRAKKLDLIDEFRSPY